MGDLRASLRLKDEDDLLLFQEKFLQEKQSASSSTAPAAKVMRVAPPAVRPAAQPNDSLTGMNSIQTESYAFVSSPSSLVFPLPLQSKYGTWLEYYAFKK